MNLFMTGVVTPPAHLPVEVAVADQALAAAVVEEVELTVLWRAVVAQERRIVLDGAPPQLIEIEPTTDIVSLTRWTNGDPARSRGFGQLRGCEPRSVRDHLDTSTLCILARPRAINRELRAYVYSGVGSHSRVRSRRW